MKSKTDTRPLSDHQTIGRSSDNSPVGQRCAKGRFAQRTAREQPGKALVEENFAHHAADFLPRGRIAKPVGLSSQASAR